MADEVNIELRAADIDLAAFSPERPGFHGVRATHGPTGCIGVGESTTPMRARHFAIEALKDSAQKYAETQAANKSTEASLTERVVALEERMAHVEGGLDALRPKPSPPLFYRGRLDRQSELPGDAKDYDTYGIGDKLFVYHDGAWEPKPK